MTDLEWRNETRRLGDLVPYADNPRDIGEAQAERLAHSKRKFRQPQTIAVGPGGEVYDGHQRLKVWMQEWGPDEEVAVRVASRALDEDERKELVVLLHEGAVGDWDWGALPEWAPEEKLLEWGFEEETLEWASGNILAQEAEQERQAIKGNKPNPRQLPLDVIYTLDMADCTCCLAVQAGLKYGFRSGQYRLCPYCGKLSGRHTVTFLDNDFKNYDHQKHVRAVKLHQPKYATVRDVMSEQQCKEANITFYPFEQIMAWAEELEQLTENVIVIPKYNCFSDIPERFVLGYSVPTSYGGTPMPAKMFGGRRVHLLGGSWKAQLEYLALLGDDVISLDTNYVQRQARLLGVAVRPDGSEFQCQDVGFSYLTNVRYAALALSFGAIGAKVNELYAGSSDPA